jgi:hypothetical protein
MHERRAALLAFVCVCFLWLLPIGLYAQSSTTGMVQGRVKDPTGAVIPGATVVLTGKATNYSSTTTTDATGRFLFPAVAPGDYSLRVSSTGFQTFIVSKVTVQVTKSYNFPVSLKVGTASQTITVSEVEGAELQTTNASIGTELGGNALQFLPTSQRNVSSLLSLQPAVAPMINGSDVRGGQVAGAASDQTTFLVDGGDATSDLEGTNNYTAIPGQPQPSPFVAVNVESTQEFRVVTAGPTSNLNRSQGGEISIVSKHGTNNFHGSAYEYYTGSTLGANRWDFNRIGKSKPHQVNNRFGFTAGGPILKNRLWFFGNYEGRRFRQSATVTTDVPTYCARNGILRFKDASGTVVPYNFNPNVTSDIASQCGVPANSPVSTLDPRSIGIDPVIMNYWQNEPLPNVPGTGDGLNSEEYIASMAEPDNENFGLLRLDYKINNRWSFFATWRQQKIFFNTADQFNITNGHQQLISATPVQPRFATFMLTGQIGSHLTTQTHGSFMRDWWGWNRASLANPSNVAGLGGTLQVSGEAQTGNSTASKPWADPINFNTQQGRARLWFGKDWYAAEDVSWLHNNHTIQFGGAWYFWNIVHQRTDDVLGGLTGGPIYWVSSVFANSGSFVNTTASQRPATCGSGLTTNCLQSSDVSRWNSMYSALLGLVDHSSQVATRDGNFNPYPLGTPAIDHVHIGSFYTYVQDIWQMRPTITFTYGLSWGVQFPPKELNGKQVLQLYSATGQPVENINAYFQARQNALDKGNPYPSLNDFTNPAFSFAPIGTSGTNIPGYTRPINTYWGSLGPRIAVAWQPPFRNRFFGDRQTVIRAGYSIQWNRTNAVGLVLTPLLGDGLMQIIGCNGPDMTGSCTGATTDASNAYRIGVDGNSLPVPSPSGGFPLVQAPKLSTPYGFNIDPAMTPPWSHNVTFDIQRSFKNNWLVDIGYIGRFSRNLENGGDINASDMFAKDPISGQTLAQAFDAISTYFRNGGKCTTSGGVVTCPGLATQPFFENMAAPGAAGAPFCLSTYGTSCTAKAASLDPTDATNGSLGRFMQLDYNLHVAAAPLDPMQFSFNFWNWGGGWSNYNAGFISVNKAFSQGLSMTFNYTWSHALGTQGLNQQYIIYGNPSPFDPSTGYGSASFDRRNVFNASWYYTLPFGKGGRFSFNNSFLNRVIGGWFTSGIWTWQSGFPLCIAADGDYGDRSGGAVNNTCAVSSTNLFGLSGRNNNVVGSGGIATNGNASGGGSGINIFSNPVAVFNGLSRPMLTQNLRPFDFNVNGFPLWNVDLSVGKNIAVTEAYKAYFTADFFNAFNVFNPASPSLDMNNPHAFGVVTGQNNIPRTIQLGLRFEF